MPHTTVIGALLLLPGLCAAGLAGAGAAEPAEMPGWIEEMKRAPRGPFARIRWFCADGAVLPPGDGACREHGGGVQHGEWNARARSLRERGFLVANLLADIRPARFTGTEARLDELRQILLEQFLVATDDGWIFREARYYRGALQVEDERTGARRLLLALAGDDDWRAAPRFLLLREAARLLPVDEEPKTAAEVRALAAAIAASDPGFAPLRVKIHGIPDPRDARLVRDYADSRGRRELTGSYTRLADLLDSLYAPQTAERRLARLAQETRDGDLKRQLHDAGQRLEAASDPAERLRLAAEFGADWRRQVEGAGPRAALDRLRLLLAGLAIEQEMFAAASRLAGTQTGADRRALLQRLRWLAQGLYGSGLLSERQQRAVERQIVQLGDARDLTAADYQAALRYLGRVPQWVQQALEFHFSRTVAQWSALTPLAAQFVPDRLRGSPLLAYSRVLDTLLQDGNRLIGLRHRLFGDEVGSGLRALNPGLRRGILSMPPADGAFRADGIYLLPSTTPELPPIAGILTRGEGSSLSHVQLLARNLGIPNVVIDEPRFAQIAAHVGRHVVLAVSPRGAVEIGLDGAEWDAVFGRESAAGDPVIEPDLDKLDLERTAPVPLPDIGAADAGRIVGPKAANLGELRRHFPDAVNPGVAIPFGAFRRLLGQDVEPGGPSAFDWLRGEYARIRALDDAAQRQQETARLLGRLRQWILDADPGDAFRGRLRAAMDAAFGDADSVGVFVRSDTNIEDLPGFTGAGLNLTLPNVVGFDAVVQAVRQVWASPFSERAHAWRQAHMSRPEHVYPAVLLLQTFASDKSGVMVTADVETGDPGWLTIAAGEGLGAAVDGQTAEQLRVDRRTGQPVLLAQAGAPLRTEPAPGGGVRKVPASGRDAVLDEAEIDRLRRLADDVERRLPMPEAAGGTRVPADIEFGFRDGRLALFQIRPFVDNARARRSTYLAGMDARNDAAPRTRVDLDRPPVD